MYGREDQATSLQRHDLLQQILIAWSHGIYGISDSKSRVSLPAAEASDNQKHARYVSVHLAHPLWACDPCNRLHTG